MERNRPAEELGGVISAAPNGPSRGGNGRYLRRDPLTRVTREGESIDDDFCDARSQVVGAAELEREKDRSRRAAVRRGRAKRPVGRRIDYAAPASNAALDGQRLVAGLAAGGGRVRNRAPAFLADSASEDAVDRARVAGEAARRQKVGRRGPADPLERRRRRNDASFRRADSRPRSMLSLHLV
jgi:hypothetical protein